MMPQLWVHEGIECLGEAANKVGKSKPKLSHLKLRNRTKKIFIRHLAYEFRTGLEHNDLSHYAFFFSTS